MTIGSSLLRGLAPTLFAIAATVTVAKADDSRTPAANPLRNAYFGELHLHTSYSLDAYIFVGTRLTPDEAYRFGRGEPVTVMGQQLRRRWPLDFMAVTDHSEMMGVLNQLDDPNSELAKSDVGKHLRAVTADPHNPQSLKEAGKIIGDTMQGNMPLPGAAATVPSAWQREIAAANGNYKPGRFTTLIAYEWSSFPNMANLHRNVFFRGDKPPLPFSSLDSDKPEDLWTYLEANRARGIEALAIPHNSNSSNGLMFDWNDSTGKPIDQAYAQRRAVNEPLVEISQTKGQSETHPVLSPNDEFANFEILDFLGYTSHAASGQRAIHGDYVREAYGRGLVIAQKVGANPYKFGVEAASDIHNGLSTSDENAFDGFMRGIDPNVNPISADALRENFGGEGETWSGLAGSAGLTGVWAEQNTRESIYDALRRKESYGTTGTRLRVRLFGGWTFARTIFANREWVKDAYDHGVPMGGDLPAKPTRAGAPQFVIWAVKDPDSGNLDRAQIVKVWLAGDGYQEKVFDVAWAGTRARDPKTGKLPPVGNTVDTKTATYTNTIGSTELRTVWQDPEFNAKVPAVYYLRVLEIPTPRWSTIAAVKAGVPLPAGVPATLQERGWSSPIWYTPKG